MTNRNGRNSAGPVATSATRISAQYGDPEAEAGFAKQIQNLTSAGETVLAVLSRSRFTEEEMPIMQAAYFRGYAEAQDEESPYHVDDLVKTKMESISRELPPPIIWLLGIAHVKLSQDGYNADRVATMHVQPAMMPSQLLERRPVSEAMNKIREG
jgi:hypothetical protein